MNQINILSFDDVTGIDGGPDAKATQYQSDQQSMRRLPVCIRLCRERLRNREARLETDDVLHAL